jgi:hypothetical protein
MPRGGWESYTHTLHLPFLDADWLLEKKTCDNALAWRKTCCGEWCLEEIYRVCWTCDGVVGRVVGLMLPGGGGVGSVAVCMRVVGLVVVLSMLCLYGVNVSSVVIMSRERLPCWNLVASASYIVGWQRPLLPIEQSRAFIRGYWHMR